MRNKKSPLLRQLLGSLTLAAFASSCTGVLNDPGVRNGLGIALRNDELHQYLWEKPEDIRGNIPDVTITGICSTELATIQVVAQLEDGSGSQISFSTPCNNGELSATFSGSNQFPQNGRYKVVFSGTTQDISAEKIEVSRVYDFYKVDNPSQMVSLTCKDDITNTTIPFENIDECTIQKTQTFRLDGECPQPSIDHGTTVQISDVSKKSCESPFSELFASLTTGSHLIPVTWLDLWGNTYTRTLLIKKLDTIDWTGGSVSFVASSTVNSADSALTLPALVGTPFVPYSADITNTIPYSRAPASTSGSGSQNIDMAPGFLSLVYGLSSSD